MTINSTIFNPVKLLGYWLICFAISLVVVFFWPVVQAEASYRVNKLQKVHFVIDPADLKKFPSLFSATTKESDLKILTPVDREFGLVIPAIGVNVGVLPNVDLADDKVFDTGLKDKVAHGIGSSFPGQKGTIYIFGHSADLTSSQAVFYLLGKLQPGDEIDVFYNGWRFVYQVNEKKIIAADDLSFLENKGDERLVLQTCWPVGTRLKRLIVVAKPLQ
jgi:LPXTG-site transpeptidase (sortase) family protein